MNIMNQFINYQNHFMSYLNKRILNLKTQMPAVAKSSDNSTARVNEDFEFFALKELAY